MLKRFFLTDPLKFLSFTILFCVLRMVIPFVNYVFVPLLFFFIVFSVNQYKNVSIRNLIRIFVKYNYQLLVITVFVLSGVINSSIFSLYTIKQILYVFVVIYLSISLFTFIIDLENFNRFTLLIGKNFILVSIIVSLLGIIKFVLQLTGIEIPYVNIYGTSLAGDYNFYVLFSFIGLISIFLLRREYKKVNLITIFLALNINILFSGSRRGIILLIVFWMCLFVFGFDLKFNYKNFKRRIIKVLLYIGIILLLSLALEYSQPNKNKNRSLDLKSNQISNIKEVTTSLLFRYLTILGYPNSYQDLFNYLWSSDGVFLNEKGYAKLKDTANGGNDLIYNGSFKYGLRFWRPSGNSTYHSIIKTPYGNGIRVIRMDGDGIGWPLLYTGRKIVFYSQLLYKLEFKYKVEKGDGQPFRIGFEAGDSYNERDLNLICTNLGNGWKLGICFYTFSRSHFDIPFFMNSQEDSTVIDFADIKLTCARANNEMPEFTDQISKDYKAVRNYLKNYDLKIYEKSSSGSLFYNGDFREGALYWAPFADSTKLKIIETPFGSGIEVTRTDGDGGYWSLRYMGRPIIYHAGHRYQIEFNYKIVNGVGIPFHVGWWVNEAKLGYKAHVLPLEISKINDGWFKAKCSYKFKETHFDLVTFLNSLKDNSIVDITNVTLKDLDRSDSLPCFVDQINKDSEIDKLLDTARDTGINKNRIYSLSSNKNKFFESRINRWEYSYILFRDSYSLSEKLIGRGFDYLEMFGGEFRDAKYDYPHNPFISAFLYSGIIGGLAYIWYIIGVFYLYIKYYKFHIYYFISFLVSFYFSFFSADTHFSIPLFSILSIIPFLTKYNVSHFQGRI